MEAETQEASQESTEVTDDMLNRAADGVDEVEEVATEDETTEETTEEGVGEEVAEGEVEETVSEEAEDVPEEPEGNGERSRLGRRVSELETALNVSRQENQESTNKLNDTLDKLTSFLGKNEETQEEEFFELPETKADLDKLIKESVSAIRSEEDTQVSNQAKEYQDGYVDTVMNLLDGDPDAKELYELINSDDFNIKHSKANTMQGGVVDAAKNLMAAKAQLSQGTVKKIPLKGEKPRAPLGGGGGDKIPQAAKKMPKLDATAAAYVKETGMSDERVMKVFG